jgi:hypothetical protein
MRSVTLRLPYRPSGGQLTTIDYPNAIVTQLNGINDFGELVG